jgi:hypothetical protein
MGGGFDRPVEETVVNNYYDDPNAQGGEHRGSEQGGERHFHESGDQAGAQLTDASYNTQGDDRNEIDANNADISQADDAANLDNAGFDGSNVDDGSGFDDTNNFDSGGFGGDSGGDVL